VLTYCVKVSVWYNTANKQICVHLPASADVTMLTLPVKCHACSTHTHACSNRSISPGCWGSKPTAAACVSPHPTDGTDRQTDARQFHRPCSTYYASSVNKMHTKYTYMMYKAVNNFFNDSFAFQKLSLTVDLIFNVFQIPADKLTASDSIVFVYAPTGNVLDTIHRKLK